MTPEERREKYEQFNIDMMNLLIAHREILGPPVDPDDGSECCCPEDPCPCVVPEGYTPTNWVIVHNWADFNMDGEAGDDWMSTDSSLGMRRSQMVGLLVLSADGLRAR